MSDFLHDALAVVDPLTAIGLFVVGVVYGASYLGAVLVEPRRHAWAFASMLLTGLVFVTYAATSRAFQGVLEWPRWIGVGVLWAVYAVGAWGGLQVRARMAA